LVVKGLSFVWYQGIYTNALILELYEPGFGVKKFGGSDNFQSLLGCFWNNLQIHIKGETTAPLEKIGKRKEDFL
jgi:hypothetical protein